MKRALPLTGIGTYQIRSKADIYSVIDEAFKNGVKLIDTAQCYRNEKTISECLLELLKAHGLRRQDIYIVSKVSPSNQGYEKTLESTRRSIEYFEYVDVMLIHWPGAAKTLPQDSKNLLERSETWRALEELYSCGSVKHIGVSNYTEKHLRELMTNCVIKPHVIQNEYHPRYTEPALRALCKEYGIVFMAYSPLGRGELVENPLIASIADKHQVPASQVLIKWSIQQDCICIPKTSRPDRVAENFSKLDNFELTATDMSKIAELNDNHKYCWDPSCIL